MIEHCNKELARYKVPRRAVLVDEPPSNAADKMVRRPTCDHTRQDNHALGKPQATI